MARDCWRRWSDCRGSWKHCRGFPVCFWCRSAEYKCLLEVRSVVQITFIRLCSRSNGKYFYFLSNLSKTFCLIYLELHLEKELSWLLVWHCILFTHFMGLSNFALFLSICLNENGHILTLFSICYKRCIWFILYVLFLFYLIYKLPNKIKAI